MDDGSTDGTDEIVKEISDKRVQYIRYENNQGACHARNVGIENAQGEYIAFQDSDDDWDDRKLEEQLNCLQQTKADLVFCQLVSKGEKIAYYPNKAVEQGYISHKAALASFMSSTQTFLGKTECIKQIKFDEQMPRFQDWDFLIRFTDSYTAFYQRAPLAVQFIGGDSVSHNAKKGYDAVVRMIKKYGKDIDNKGMANLLMLQGTFVVQLGEEGATEIFQKAMRLYPYSTKLFVKLIMSRMGVLDRWYGRK